MVNSDGLNTVFVLGMNKTGTTTMVNLLNAHPSVFIMMQIDFTHQKTWHRNKQLVENFPESASLF